MLLLFFIMFFIYMTNVIFTFHKTAYTLVSSVFIFLFVSLSLFYLEFEFLALSFLMIYMGGIAVMFLYLILMVDVKVENTKNLFVNKSNFFLILNLVLFFVILFFYMYKYNFDPFIFNSLKFQDVLANSLYLLSNAINFDFNFELLNFYYMCDFNFSDMFILGVYMFKFNSILILLIGLHLLMATMVSMFLCTNIFQFVIE